MNGVMVCGEVVDVLWDDRAGFNPLELVYAYEAVVYDSGDSTLLSLARVGGGHRGGGQKKISILGPPLEKKFNPPLFLYT